MTEGQGESSIAPLFQSGAIIMKSDLHVYNVKIDNVTGFKLS